MKNSIENILSIKEILSGNKLTGARMIRLIEENDPQVFELLKQLYPYSGQALIIGITGSPGVGKSTLINSMIREFRNLDKRIAVVAVDPSSPVSGGAILGDRIRMQKHATDENVFIRSMASRGEKGGLSRAAKDAVIVLDTMGYEIIIIETVGAGQGEFEIANLAHSIGIVTIPGAGDGMQAVKAGILEKGDIFIVNKSDKPDVDQTLHQLNMMLEMRTSSRTDSIITNGRTSWTPKVLKTSAQNGKGVKEVVDTFLSHFDFMKKSNTFDTKKDEMEILYFNELLEDLTLEKILKSIKNSDRYMETLTKIQSREIDPLSAAELLTDKLIEQ